MSPPLHTHWKPEEDALIRRMVAEKATRSEIAKALADAGFRTCSRSAVIARLRRLDEAASEPQKPPRRLRVNNVNIRRPKPKPRIPAAEKVAAMASARMRSYDPAPIIAGLPTTVQIHDIEGNRIAPVTLRRIATLEVRT